MLKDDNKNISVLTIDDDCDMRTSIASYLEDMGFIVYQASGGREGIEMFERHNPDLVFTDLMMPEVDGVAVVEAITQISPHTPLVVISGNSCVEYAINTVRKGAWDYITKPIHDFAQLEKVADQVLDRAQTLKLAKKQAQCLEEEKEKQRQTHPIQEVASGIAHDFKNLLTGVIGNLSLAKYNLDVSHKSIKAIERAEMASMRASELAQQLMNLSKPKVCVSKKAQAARIIDECVALSFPNSKIQFKIYVEENLPHICMSEGELSQILNNLILNSAQAMAGSGVLSISAETVSSSNENSMELRGGDYVRIMVADNGCGIPADIMAKIFDIHFTTKPNGNGLGLASIRKLIKKNRGYITMESVVGAGTTAIVILPVANESLTT